MQETTGNVHIGIEVKEVTKTHPRLITETMDIKKSVIVCGTMEKKFMDRIIREYEDINLIKETQ